MGARRQYGHSRSSDQWSSRAAPSPEKRWNLIVMRQVVLAILVLLLAAYVIYREYQKSLFDRSNALAMGPQATIHYNDIRSGDDWKWKEILQARLDVLQQYPFLLQADYKVSRSVFHKIDDTKPWLLLQNLFFYGASAAPAYGPPSDIRWIANPFILVYPEFRSFSISGNPPIRWKKNIVTPEILASPSFPLYPVPGDLLWSSGAASALLSYNLSSYVDILSQYVEQKPALTNFEFGVLAGNAQDFGYRFIYLKLGESSGISKSSEVGKVSQIFEFVLPHKMESSELVLNRSLAMTSGVSKIRVKSLPARAVFYLWKSKPGGPEEEPDFRFVLEMR